MMGLDMEEQLDRGARFTRIAAFWPAYYSIFVFVVELSEYVFPTFSEPLFAHLLDPILSVIAPISAAIGFLACLFDALVLKTENIKRIARLGVMINGGLLALYLLTLLKF